MLDKRDEKRNKYYSKGLGITEKGTFNFTKPRPGTA